MSKLVRKYDVTKLEEKQKRLLIKVSSLRKELSASYFTNEKLAGQYEELKAEYTKLVQTIEAGEHQGLWQTIKGLYHG